MTPDQVNPRAPRPPRDAEQAAELAHAEQVITKDLLDLIARYDHPHYPTDRAFLHLTAIARALYPGGPVLAELARRRGERVAALRDLGESYQQIGASVGMQRQAVYALEQRALRPTTHTGPDD